MYMVIQHNLQAANSNRMLNITTQQVGSSTEKLSSGYRINRAADDAAGLSISEKMRKQIRGLSRALVNSEDGISCVQTADGAMNEVQDMLQRMNELCVKGANGTLSVTDREYIQDEIDQLISEIDRISETAKFNETYLLKGDDKNKSEVYITDYAISPTRTTTELGELPLNGDPIDKKILYKGTNNMYFVSSDITKNGTQTLTADVIHTGDDISPYLVYEDTEYNNYHVGLSDDYKTFVNCELDSRLTDVGTDLVKDDNGVIIAKRTLYFYDTNTGTVTKLDAGDEVSQFLNDDNTVNDRYRNIDIMDGTGKSRYDQGLNKGTAYAEADNTAVYYYDENRTLQTVTYNEGEAITKSVYTVDGVGRYGFQVRSGIVHQNAHAGCDITALHNHIPSDAYMLYTNDSGEQNLYKIDVGDNGYIYYCQNGDLNKTIKLVNVADSSDVMYVKAGLFTDTHKNASYAYPYDYTKFTYVIPYTTYNWDTSTSDGGFEWTDDLIGYEYTPEKLYDADGNEVSAIRLNDFFDDNGNYKGGLFNNHTAASIHEVFNSGAAPSDARNIEFYIKQLSTLENESLEINIQAGPDSDRHNKVGIEIANLNAACLGINKLATCYIGIVDKTGEKATDAIDVVANALTEISRQRAKMGAIQNRLEHTIKNLNNIVENTTAAESQIRDVDMAEEMVRYSNFNILQQAGQSMLAQANQSNQGVLSLLQ